MYKVRELILAKTLLRSGWVSIYQSIVFKL